MPRFHSHAAVSRCAVEAGRLHPVRGRRDRPLHAQTRVEVEREQPLEPAGVQQQRVAGLDRDALRLGDLLDHRAGDREALVGRAVVVALGVDQHAAPDDAALRPLVDAALAALVDVLVLAAAPVAVLAVAHVREGVPLAGALQVEAIEPVVARLAAGLDVVREAGAIAERRVRLVEREIEVDHLARADQPRGRDHVLRRQPVERPDLVVASPDIPGVVLLAALVHGRQVVVGGRSGRWRHRVHPSRSVRGVVSAAGRF